MSVVKKAIIPVAGLGTRFLPATKAQPKEMLPVVDKPVVQYLVEEAVASGISEIIFITGRGKRAIEDHFDYAPELELVLQEKGKKELLDEMRRLSKMAKFTYVRQNEPRGDGDALLCAEYLIGDDEPVAVLFGDVVVDAEPPCLRQLMDVFKKYGDSVVALEKVAKKDVSRYGVVLPEKIDERTVRIKDVIEKPSPEKAPSNLVITGKYIITRDVFGELKAIKEDRGESFGITGGGELRLADALKGMARKKSVYGYLFKGTRYDCGSKIGFLKATVDFGLKHKETKKEFVTYLKDKVKGL